MCASYKMTNPWVTDNKSEENLTVVDQSFEDNFQPFSVFAQLPDSKEYLETLERKLQKISKDSGVLQQLSQRRNVCLERLLNNQISIQQTESDLILNEAVSDLKSETANEIIRHIRPEQPLTVGEIVPIIKYDHLEIADEEEEEKATESDSGASR